MAKLDGLVCVVTGGASGLGLEIANKLLASGSKVIVLDFNQKSLDALAGTSNLETRLCDVSKADDVQEAVSAITESYGGIDVLVNNVGILYSSPMVSMAAGHLDLHDLAMWERVITTNLSSVFITSREVVGSMVKTRKKGIIVNISSVCASGNAGQSAYSAAKAGVEALTKVWSKELAALGIRCFAVAPGFFDTPSTRLAISESVLKQTVARIPVKRLGRAEEVAAFVIAGIENDYLHGKVIQLDGGLVI